MQRTWYRVRGVNFVDQTFILLGAALARQQKLEYIRGVATWIVAVDQTYILH